MGAAMEVRNKDEHGCGLCEDSHELMHLPEDGLGALIATGRERGRFKNVTDEQAMESGLAARDSLRQYGCYCSCHVPGYKCPTCGRVS